MSFGGGSLLSLVSLQLHSLRAWILGPQPLTEKDGTLSVGWGVVREPRSSAWDTLIVQQVPTPVGTAGSTPEEGRAPALMSNVPVGGEHSISSRTLSFTFREARNPPWNFCCLFSEWGEWWSLPTECDSD